MTVIARGASALSRAPWWLPPLAVALVARLVFLFVADEPLLYAHPYNYVHGALGILEHPRPWQYVLTSDNWHRWLGPWTIAPLYYLFVAAVFALTDHLVAVQLLQVFFDALVAVAVAWMGRLFAGRAGGWAGIAYALDFHSVEQCAVTLTENLHTPLLVAGMVALIAEARRVESGEPAGRRLVLLGGFLLGLSALARSVSTAFVPLAALWRWRVTRDRPGLVAAALVATGAAIAILPWTVRNVVFIGDFVPVETNAVYNFYDDNVFLEGAARARQEARVASEPTLAAQRSKMMSFALRGLAANPGKFAEKAWRNMLHLIRPDGLHNLLVVEDPMPAWRHAALILLDDVILLPAVVLFTVFLFAGPPTAARRLVAWWSAYYLLMVVVVFHNEIRYRSTLLPFALAGAAGGWVALREGDPRGRWRRAAGLAVGGALAVWVVVPYVLPGVRALRAAVILRGLDDDVARQDLAAARARVERAASVDPGSARPWLRLGGALARADRPAEALAAYEEALRRKGHVWTPVVVRPALLEAAGKEAPEVTAAVEAARSFSWNVDPWLAQEVAWRTLPPPRTDDLRLGDNDYGATRGFMNAHRGYRWTRHHACLRVRPRAAAAVHTLTLWMGMPDPSPMPSAAVEMQPRGGRGITVTVGREVAPFRVEAPADDRGVVEVCLEAPTWSRKGEPAEQGVRVDRMQVGPGSP
jgi:hypothetical protein